MIRRWAQENSSPKDRACLPKTKPRGASTYREGKKHANIISVENTESGESCLILWSARSSKIIIA